MILKLKHKTVNLETSAFFIAEIGFNFCNDINLAKEMIIAAKESGANAVKFQSFKADGLLLKTQPAYKIIKENELSNENHFKLMEFCDKYKVDFFSTAFDVETLKFLINDLKVKILKIASGDFDCLPLLETAARSQLPIILSTGFSDYQEITRTVNFIKKYNKKYMLLHCVSNYPLNPEDANLLAVAELKKKYKCPVGFSDHSLGSHLCCAAAALGARVFEKHFTIDRKLGTIDNPISTEPQEFKRMTAEITDIIKALGTGKKDAKILAKESEIKKFARRTIYAAASIRKGEKFTENNLKIVRPFISAANRPFDYKKLLGKKSSKNYRVDEPIKEFNIYSKKGFTLIEILIVVAILGILISIVSINLTGKTDDARINAAKMTMKKIETALKMFYNDNGFYPDTEQGLKALIEKPTTGRIPQNYPEGGYLEAKKTPKDPWGNNYVYIFPGIENPNRFDLICYGADGQPGGEGINKDISLWDIE